VSWLRRRVPFIAQVEAADCGPASLAAVLAYHGRSVNLAVVRAACPASRDGTSARAIIGAANVLGLEADAFKATLDDLHNVPMPAIAFWNFNHFIVIEAVTSTRVVAMDPAAGRVQLTREAALKAFSGVVLTLKPRPEFQRERRTRPALGRYLAQLRSNRSSLAQIGAISVCIQLLSLSLPIATKVLMDASRLPSYTTWIFVIAGGLGTGIVAGVALSTARGVLIQQLQTAISYRLTVDMVRHLLSLPLAYFMQRRSGDVIQRMNSVEAVRSVLTSAFTSSLLDGVTLLILLAFATYLNPVLGLIILGAAVLKGTALWRSRTLTADLVTAEVIAEGAETTALIEMFASLETVRATGSEQAVVERWYRKALNRVNDGIRRRRVEGYEQITRDLLTAGGIAAILAAGARLAQSGAATAGDLAALLVISGLINAPLDSLLNTLGQFQHLDRHLMWIEDVTSAPAEHSGTKTLDQGALSVELQGVSFRYTPTGQDVVDGVSISIAAGQHVAIVGPSGAGKSTLARMLVGLIEPTKGAVRFGGAALRELNLKWLRSRVAMVLQDVSILEDDVIGNLRLYRPEASFAEVQRAAETAAIHDVISRLPGGYTHPLTNNGRALSGGQRQRLAIARTLLANPAVLVLDEATSALDAETERRVFERLRERELTRISIAHRFETIRNADRIYVLDRGRVVQTGTYDELMEQEHGLFRSLAFTGL
jgi:ATP-binding cassette subfamily B protein